MQLIDDLKESKFVLSVDAGKTTKLIKDYAVYHCPMNDNKPSGKHRKCQYFAPRSKLGSMPRLYKIKLCIIVDMNKWVDECNNIEKSKCLTKEEFDNLKKYVIRLSPKLTGYHRFYILDEGEKLSFSLPLRENVNPKNEKNNTHSCYFLITEIRSNVEFPKKLESKSVASLEYFPFVVEKTK